MTHHRSRYFVCYADTDGGGVIYHARYLEFFERARWAFFESLGFRFKHFHDRGVLFPITRIEIQYRKPGLLGDEVEVQTKVQETKRASFCFHQTLYRVEDNTLLCEATIKIACMNEKGKPQELPPNVRDTFASRS